MPTPRISLEVHDLRDTKPQYVARGESSVPGALPRAPKDLSKDEKKRFRSYVRTLAARRTVTAGDGTLIAILVRTESRCQIAQTALVNEGLVKIYQRLGADGVSVDVEKPNLHLKIVEVAERSCVQILVRLGLTPRDRDAVKEVATPKRSIEEVDQLERDSAALHELLAERAAQIVPEPELSLDDIHEELVGNDAPFSPTPALTAEQQALLDEADRLIEEDACQATKS